MAVLATKTNPTARRITRNRPPQITTNRQPLHADAYYTIRELTDRASPFYTVSAATIFRALKSGALTASYIGRKVLLRGSVVRAWIEGGAV